MALRPRDMRFDWSGLPMHWVPGDPFTTHFLNVLHLLLPEGERWFVRVFSEALPLIRDERLAEEVRGFIGQEAVHAEVHQGGLDHLHANGLDAQPYVAQVRWLFRQALGRRELPTARLREEWLVERVAGVAAIEHRAVAFELYQHLDGSYLRRIRQMLVWPRRWPRCGWQAPAS